MIGFIFALACFAIWNLSPDRVELMEFDRSAILHSGEWWRMWTAHFTHFTRSQLIADAGTVFFLALLIERFTRIVYLGVAFFISMPLITVMILTFVPGMEHFRGASSMMVMLWMVVGLYLIIDAKGFSVRFVFGGLLLMVLAAKLAAEFMGLMPPSGDLPRGVLLPWQAHMFGAVTGFVVFAGLYQIKLTSDRPVHKRQAEFNPLTNKPLPKKLKDHQLPDQPQDRSGPKQK